MTQVPNAHHAAKTIESGPSDLQDEMSTQCKPPVKFKA